MSLRTVVRSVRFRIALISSAAVFGTSALAVGTVYMTVTRYLENDMVTRLRVEGAAIRIGDQVVVVPRTITPEQVQSVGAVYRQLVLNQVTVTILAVLVVLFAVSMVMGWFSAGRVLRPLGSMIRVARDIEARDLSRRIEVVNPDDELGQMASTFNSMLDRLERSFAQQRTFLAQTSHDLRTPLAVMRSNLEVAALDPDTDVTEWRRTAEVAIGAGDRMSRMVDSLLAAARFEVGSAEPVDVDLAEFVVMIADELGARADIEAISEPGVVVSGDEAALTRAVENLVENAIAAGTGTILVRSGIEGEWAYVAVADRGPGFDPDLLRSSPGLGLAIAARVAESHGGRLDTVPRVGGGSVVILFLKPKEGNPLSNPVAIRLGAL